MSLRIAKNLQLPTEAITKTFALLAQRRKGKTYTASVMAEEMVDAKLPWVALDPTGAWWGLRSSADGKSAGLPVYVFGGDHGDLPLERTAGALIADVVVDHPGWYVLDFSHFESKEAERQFATDFAERFYRRKGTNKAPMHLFVDEADMFCPQRVPSGDQRMLGAFESIVRRGGIRGIGTTLISQRAAVLNKNVLEQIDVLIALRTVGPNDRKAIAGYVEAHGSTEQQHELMDSIAGLGLGEAWVWEPGEDLFQRVQIRQRRTFNSSATPDSTKQALTPARMAPVDLERIRHQLATLVQKAEQDDPQALRRRIAELERARPKATVQIQEVVRYAVPGEVIAEARSTAAELRKAADRLEKLVTAGADGRSLIDEPSKSFGERPAPKVERPSEVEASAVHESKQLTSDEPVQLKAGARRILEVLARHHPMKVTRAQAGTLAGLKITGGAFLTYWSALKRADLIQEDGKEVSVTEAGLTKAGVAPANPMTTEELLEMWHGSLKSGARTMLDQLVERFPDGLTREELAERMNMASSGGAFQDYLGTLRRNGLIDFDGTYYRASASLFIRNAA
jgi:Helicase HerA-like C-terminal